MKARTPWIVVENDCRAGQCIWCPASLGAEHHRNCPVRRRSVVVKFTFEIVTSEPECFDGSNIEFFYTRGSSCASNIVSNLERLDQRVPCLCGFQTAEYIREATAEDEDKNQLFIEELKKQHDVGKG